MRARFVLINSTALMAIVFGTAPVHARAGQTPPDAVGTDAPTTDATDQPVDDATSMVETAADAPAPTAIPSSDAANTVDTNIVGRTGLPGRKDDIVVVGLRGSVASAVKKKRDSKQIVDTVVSEDAGKLPDNNVVEALSRVTGVNITRSQGQGDGLTIRGLSGVQTTVNGAEVGAAGSRSLSLSDIPAELIKSVSVYKNRTADQVEGGIGGTVDIELRRPLDLKKGLTVAGSIRGSYDSQSKKVSPYGSILIADRFENSLGKFGFLINAGYQKTFYNEPFVQTDSPYYFYNYLDPTDPFRSKLYQTFDPALRDTVVAPYRSSYGVNSGRRTQPSISAVTQWAPSERLSFILEASYFGNRSTDQYNNLFVNTREDYYTLSNIRTGKYNELIGYTVNNDDPNVNYGGITAGISSGQSTSRSNTYHTNFETHWNAPGVRIDASAQYDWSNNTIYSNGYDLGLLGVRSVDVDFASSKIPAGGPSFDFGNYDITDPNNLYLSSVRDNLEHHKSTMFAAQVDMSLDVSTRKLLRSIQIGARYRITTNRDNSGYRDANFGDREPNLRPKLGDVPGVSTQIVSPPIRDAARVSWNQLNSAQFYNNFDQIRAFAIAQKPIYLSGPGSQNGVAALFASARPEEGDIVYTSGTRENAFAVYGNLNYAFKAGFPIDGTVGLRAVNTFGTFSGVSLQGGRFLVDGAGNPILDENGARQPLPDVIVNDSSRANYIDLFPSIFGIVHFTPKLQLRGSYSLNVDRPGFGALRAYRNVFFGDPRATIYAGNPDLKPTRTNDFNVSLEYYFGRGGVASIGGFFKKQKGFIYETRQLEPVPEFGNALRFVQQPRNAGPGETRGVEAAVTSFFSFLPGAFKNFGATVNATWIPKAVLSLPYEIDPENNPGVYGLSQQKAPFTSKFTYNLIAYYETPTFSARVAYNWRSKYKTGVDAINQTYITSSPSNSRLDAAINVTPVRFLTLSLEGTNLLEATDKYYYNSYPDLPNGFRQQGRTIQFSGRFRF